VLAENLVRRCDPATLNASLSQLIERKRDLDFPWFPARVVCHDILGQTALVDLAGLRDAIAEQGGDPALVNPVVPVQLIVDHSLAVECGGFDPQAFEKNRAIEDRRNEDRFHFIDWTKKAFQNVDVIPPGNGIMHQINLEKMSPVIQVPTAWPIRTPGRHRQPHAARRCAGRDRHRRGRPGSGNRDAGPRLVDAPAGHRRRRTERQAAAGHHRHRHRAGADRIPAQGKSGVGLSGILRRRRPR
jgi:aconitate hydratase